jgi:tetratricopeptide (TPR) repeat protein
MKKIAFIFILVAAIALLAAWKRGGAAEAGTANLPTYTADGKLNLPANYRDWVFLTSGFGMNYANGTGSNPMFTNVFVSPEAYQGFKATAKWPDKSMFIVEIYSPASHGSINKGGHYQDSYIGLDVEVKDSSRPNEWSYYNFNPGETVGAPDGPGCNKCHTEHAAVEHTFVQFYPTLLDFAIEKGVVRPAISIPLNSARLLKLLNSAGWEKAEQAYYEDKKKNPESDLLGEKALNQTGYSLLREKKNNEAISVFKLAAKDYPNSVNAYDSLGDAYAAAGQRELAVSTSQKELELAQNDTKLTAEQKKQFTTLAQKRIAEMNKR